MTTDEIVGEIFTIDGYKEEWFRRIKEEYMSNIDNDSLLGF